MSERTMTRTSNLVMLFLGLMMLTGMAKADELLKPFMLASNSPGDVKSTVLEVTTKLQAAGFEVVGEYSPYEDAAVVIVTSDALKKAAARSEFGGYGAGQRISVTKVGDDVQVAYTNPEYMAHAYRMEEYLEGVRRQFEKTLGFVNAFGPEEGMEADDIREYHYMFGMEYFDEPSLLAEYGTHNEAVEAVEKSLVENKGGAGKVYRIDIPAKEESVFGVSLTNGCSSDKFIMGHIDFKSNRSTAHLPYEMLVSGNRVYALYARFRIAINFPDLKMMGANSFFKIMCAPDAIEKALIQAAGGKVLVDEFDDF